MAHTISRIPEKSFSVLLNILSIKFDELVKSYEMDSTVKSSGCKALESLGMTRTYLTS